MQNNMKFLACFHCSRCDVNAVKSCYCVQPSKLDESNKSKFVGLLNDNIIFNTYVFEFTFRSEKIIVKIGYSKLNKKLAKKKGPNQIIFLS